MEPYFVEQENKAAREAAEQPLTAAEMKANAQPIGGKKGVALDGGFIYIRQRSILRGRHAVACIRCATIASHSLGNSQRLF